MATITAQIEAVLNSRPFCPLSDDVTEFSALTLGHFFNWRGFYYFTGTKLIRRTNLETDTLANAKTES